MAELKHRDLWFAFWENPDSADAIGRLIEAWIPLVHDILRRIAIRLPPSVQVEDLFQSAVIGLYGTIERFNPDHGVSFRTFASPRIRGAILDELRNGDHMTRSERTQFKKVENAIQKWTNERGRPPDEEELAEAAAMAPSKLAAVLDRAHPWLSLDQAVAKDNDGRETYLRDIIPDTSSPVPDREAEREDMRGLLRRVFRRLSRREQKILYLYYFEELRLSEIAVLFEVSEARICQIHALTLVKMRAAMGSCLRYDGQPGKKY